LARSTEQYSVPFLCTSSRFYRKPRIHEPRTGLRQAASASRFELPGNYELNPYSLLALRCLCQAALLAQLILLERFEGRRADNCVAHICACVRMRRAFFTWNKELRPVESNSQRNAIFATSTSTGTCENRMALRSCRRAEKCALEHDVWAHSSCRISVARDVQYSRPPRSDP
jgi:hypothetical protein